MTRKFHFSERKKMEKTSERIKLKNEPFNVKKEISMNEKVLQTNERQKNEKNKKWNEIANKYENCLRQQAESKDPWIIASNA